MPLQVQRASGPPKGSQSLVYQLSHVSIDLMRGFLLLADKITEAQRIQLV